MQPQPNFSFEISLSVLNHLGRNLYRSFATVLGEAISNAWDAEANNVWIYIDRENSTLLIKDDGVGMTADDFQQKFLRIGYTKRRDGQSTTSSGRPYIGRKGIGKLALLSCADKIAVISKVQSAQYIGGVIDSSDLDHAITDDLTPDQYPLEAVNMQVFNDHTNGHDHGTLIYFEGIKDGIRNTLDNLKKTVALYFRFSLLDNDFNIYINDELVDVNCLSDLAGNTEFLWRINSLDDPYLDKLHSNFTTDKNEDKQLTVDSRVKGFVASVAKPSNLKIIGTGGEEVTVDLFVNGRLRERDILKHIPTARVAESYLYGQIHFNDLDDSEDRFTSSRESVVANDPKFEELLKIISEEIMRVILVDWDVFRRKHREDGDSEADGPSKKERKSEELYNAVAQEYVSASDDHSEEARKVDTWIQDLGDDAKFNFGSYAECFMAENLIRKYIEDTGAELSDEAKQQVAQWKTREAQNKTNGNVSIDIRKNAVDLSYLEMMPLAKLVDNTTDANNLPNDAKQYRPVRDALMHTALLTDEAKRKLTTIFDNMQARVKSLLSGAGNQDDS